MASSSRSIGFSARIAAALAVKLPPLWLKLQFVHDEHRAFELVRSCAQRILELGSCHVRVLNPERLPTDGAVMLVFLLMLGTLFAHVRRGLILKTNRLSGWCIIGLNALMALTGWLLYYISDDTARAWSSVVHWSIGLAALPALYTHILLGRTSTAALGDNVETYGAQPDIKKTRAAKNQRDWS